MIFAQGPNINRAIKLWITVARSECDMHTPGSTNGSTLSPRATSSPHTGGCNSVSNRLTSRSKTDSIREQAYLYLTNILGQRI